MNRSPYVELFCAIAMLLTLGQDALAFWKGVGRMSGPGPFWGVETILPFTFGRPDPLTRDLLDRFENRRILNESLFAAPEEQLPRMWLRGVDFLRDDESVRIIGARRGNDDLQSWRSSGVRTEDLAERFLAAVGGRSGTRSGAPGGFPTTAEQSLGQESVEARLTALNLWLDEFFDSIVDESNMAYRTRVRYFGFSPAGLGLFNSQRTIRLNDVDNRDYLVGDRLLTVSIGYTQSFQNKLDYPDPYAGSRTVRSLTLYPAFEQRFALSRSQKTNLFANAGPAVHYFWGDAFENFSKFSARARFGIRHGNFSFGAEVDLFAPRIKHTDFASTDLGTHQWGWGLFVGVELGAFSLGN